MVCVHFAKTEIKSFFFPECELGMDIALFYNSVKLFYKKNSSHRGICSYKQLITEMQKNSLLKAGTILLISLHKECFCWVTKIQDKTISKIFISCQEFSQKNFFLNFHCCYEARNYPVGTLNCFHNLSKSHLKTAENKHKIIASFVNFTSLYTDFSLEHWNYVCMQETHDLLNHVKTANSNSTPLRKWI